jgi:outer membrane receptor protein involved in Fe transport
MKCSNIPAGLAYIFAAALALPANPMLKAQSAAATTPPQDETVLMNPFEVSTTQGHGYITTNSAAGLKTNESLMGIPQQVLVITRDMIDDLGYVNTSDTMRFAGIANGFQGESLKIRGASIGYATIDDMLQNQGYEDTL